MAEEVRAKAYEQTGTSVGLMQADALAAMRELPSNIFNVAVTSPPYYWARDYGFEGQIGHEDTVEQFVSGLADVFDEVKRTLHPEGVFYLNIGDTYYSGNGQPHGSDPRSPSRNFMRQKMRPVDRSGWGIPKKSMIGIPWKVAFEMQKRGWTLRTDIIWNRLNAFVEPTARDRPHRQYEHLFMFTKSRFYSFDRTQLRGEEDVWNIPIERGRQIEHNAPFPHALAERCILTASPLGGHVLDPFVGSGTTVYAAIKHGRNCVGIDMSADYIGAIEDRLLVDNHAVRPWEQMLGHLQTEPTGWNEWLGNKRNFRKPGTPKEDFVQIDGNLSTI